MSEVSRSRQAAATPPLHAVARMFVVLCIVLALVGVVSFWPPRSPAIVAWLLVWTITCLGTSIAILRRARYAPSLVWTLLALAGYSAISAFRSGIRGGVCLVIEILLAITLVWFAIWYKRRRRVDSARGGALGSSE